VRKTFYLGIFWKSEREVGMNAAAATLRADVEDAVLAEVERVGSGAFNRATVVKVFLARGAKQSTVYRWIDAVLGSGKPEERAARAITAAASERSQRTQDPAKEVAGEVAAKLPTVPRLEHIATVGVVPVIDRLNVCLQVADELMSHARSENGTVRNSRLLLTASEHLRRCIDTAARITDTLMRAEKIERYHSAIIGVIAEESPETAERILARISQLTAAWGNA
jgi:hypothetical protein